MGENVLLLIAAGALLFALVGRLSLTGIITPPMVFLMFGGALAFFGLTHADHGAQEALHLIAEVTLVLVLFTDAAQIDLAKLRSDHQWPVRMLLIGLPLAVAIGTVFFQLLLPTWSIWEAALLAAILAPTDAALGQSVVSDPAVPERARRTLSVESGLNDGLALPAVVLFACMATTTHSLGGVFAWAEFGIRQVVLGPIAGIVVGLAGAYAMAFSATRGWTDRSFEGIGVLAIAALCYLVAAAVGGNGFISAFVGGLCFGNRLSHDCEFAYEFAETEGRALILGAFMMIGVILLPQALASADATAIAVAILSLFIIRPVAIWLSLIGTNADAATRGFLGWFGPRGLASGLFALLVLSQIKSPHAQEILMIVILTVGASTVLHGLSAAPGAARFGRWATRNEDLAVMRSSATPSAKRLRQM